MEEFDNGLQLADGSIKNLGVELLNTELAVDALRNGSTSSETANKAQVQSRRQSAIIVILTEFT